MNRSQSRPAATRRKMILFSGAALVLVAMIAGLWSATAGGRGLRNSKQETETAGKLLVIPVKKVTREDDRNLGRSSSQSLSGATRQSLPFRGKLGEPEAVLEILASGSQTVEERVTRLQGIRGKVLSHTERESALAFLAGQQVPKGMNKGSQHWLADELLTVLRQQQPPWEGLAVELGEVAALSETDPVVRDYLMQHLGHVWEQDGAREEIEKSLWQAVGSADETTPGTALMALSRGYQRDQQPASLDKVRQQALILAQNPATGLAVRVTALSIAGEGGGPAVKELSASLIADPGTPVILRKVAERVVQ
jgi:hypothetical protein